MMSRRSTITLLARALHALTGYPIRIMQEPGYVAQTEGRLPCQTNPDDWEFGHACVELPNGRVLDLRGACSAEQMLAFWAGERKRDIYWRELTQAQVEWELDQWYGYLLEDDRERHIVMRIANYHARLLLANLLIDPVQ